MRRLLRDKRIEKTMTQQEIADRLGIERSYYANIELGIKNPSLRVALKIKEVLEVKSDDIFLNE